MAALITLVLGNLGLLAAILAFHGLVTRRRERIHGLVEHLAAVARKALPLATGLRVMAADLGGMLGVRLDRVARRLEDGARLDEALEAEPSAFPPLVRSLAALGERSGHLSAFLDELRRAYRRMEDTAARSVYAFFYPVLLTALISLMLIGLNQSIIPKFNEIFIQLGVVNSYEGGWDVLFIAIEATFGLSLLLTLVIASGGGSVHFGGARWPGVGDVADRLVLALPMVRGVVRDASAAQFLLALSLFLRAGASLPAAVRAAAGAERNRALARRYRRVADAVDEGRRLSEAARSEGGLGGDLAWFLETGEASGALPDHLRQASALADARARFAAHMSSRALIPLFVLLNGALVLGACALVFLPIRDILWKTVPW